MMAAFPRFVKKPLMLRTSYERSKTNLGNAAVICGVVLNLSLT